MGGLEGTEDVEGDDEATVEMSSILLDVINSEVEHLAG